MEAVPELDPELIKVVDLVIHPKNEVRIITRNLWQAAVTYSYYLHRTTLLKLRLVLCLKIIWKS